MERLTFEGNCCDIAQCRDLQCKYDGNCTQRQVWERLLRLKIIRTIDPFHALPDGMDEVIAGGMLYG